MPSKSRGRSVSVEARLVRNSGEPNWARVAMGETGVSVMEGTFSLWLELSLNAVRW